MNSCRDCKHWDPSRGAGAGLCRLISRSTYSYPPEQRHEELAWTLGAYGYESDLYTSPEFGCVQWSQK